MKKIVVAVLVVMLLVGALMGWWLHPPSTDEPGPALAAATNVPPLRPDRRSLRGPYKPAWQGGGSQAW